MRKKDIRIAVKQDIDIIVKFVFIFDILLKTIKQDIDKDKNEINFSKYCNIQIISIKPSDVYQYYIIIMKKRECMFKHSLNN